MATDLLRSEQAADYLGVPRNRLAKWRMTGVGPVYAKLGPRIVVYTVADLDRWLEGSRRVSTTEKPRVRVAVVTRPSEAA